MSFTSSFVLSVVMLNVVILKVVMLSVVMLNVVAPTPFIKIECVLGKYFQLSPTFVRATVVHQGGAVSP